MNVFDLCASIKLDTNEYKRQLGEAESASSKSGINIGSAFSSLASGIASAMKTTIEVTTAAITAVGGAAAALTKSAVESYADYEQLVGGVETLFGSSYASLEEYVAGEGATLYDAEQCWEQYSTRQETVLENASNAYKTAGMSANEYMETVTSFAASLNSSLGENAWQSANYANTAIIDMADNANKMGTDIESIENAYMGFSKQNYTMLDNLKLGYGGTKEEMERLLADAEEYEGLMEGSLDVSSFADIVEAIDIVQEHLGIAGTTAKEASSTISGSISTMKSAWTNLLAGMGNKDADVGTLISNFTESVVTVANNIAPIVEQALPTIVESLGEVVSELEPYIPEILDEVAPALLDASVGLVNQLVEHLPELIDVLVQAAPQLANGIGQVLSAVLENLPAILDSIKPLFTELFGAQVSTELFGAFQTTLEGIMQTFNQLSPIITGIFNQLAPIFSDIIASVLPEISRLLDLILPPVLQIVSDLLPTLDAVLSPILDLLDPLISLLEPILDIVMTILSPLIQLLNVILPPLSEFISAVLGVALEDLGILLEAISIYLKEHIGEAVDKVKEDFEEFKEKISLVFLAIKTIMKPVIEWVHDNIIDKFVTAKDKAVEAFEEMKEKIGSIFDGIKEFVKTGVNGVIGFVESMCNGVIGAINGMINAINGIKINVPDWVTDKTGLEDFSLNIPNVPEVSLPRLANGGIISDPTALIAGEDGAEAIVPLERNTEWVNKLREELNTDEQIDLERQIVVLLEEVLGTMPTSINLDGRKVGKLING